MSLHLSPTKRWGKKKLDGGLANSNYRVDTPAGPYLLKICDEKDKRSLQVSSKARTLEVLSSHDEDMVPCFEVQVAALNVMRAAQFPTCFPHPLKGVAGYVLCQNNDKLRSIIYDFLRVRPWVYEAASSSFCCCCCCS